MEKTNIFIYGCGGLGREVVELIECINNKNNQWKICGFIDDNESMEGSTIGGYEVFSLNKVEDLFSKDDTKIVVAIGDPKIKKMLVQKVEQIGFKFATLIHPLAYISRSAKIGEGCIVKSGCSISTGTIIKNHVLINLGCTIGHDVLINDYVTLSLGCNISGTVTIEKSVFIGSGANVRDELNIGENSIIGIGSTVVKDIRHNVVAYGNPAREIKSSIGLKIF